MNESVESPIPPTILKNIGDRSYEKRKAAALELERLVREQAESPDAHLLPILEQLRVDFVESHHPNRRKGGLIGLAACAIALGPNLITYLDHVLMSVLTLLDDQDSRVRYYACESLYNISKVARGNILVAFNQIFSELCKLHSDPDQDVRNGGQLLDRLIKDIVTESAHFELEGFIPLLRETIAEENPQVRQLVVGWITVLDSVPDLDMLEFLPEYLGGLFDMLSDGFKDVRQQADACLEEFLREIKESLSPDQPDFGNGPSLSLGSMVQILVHQCESLNKPPICRVTALNWILEFIQIEEVRGFDTDDLVIYYGDLVRAVLVCISDDDQNIRVKSEHTNSRLLEVFQSMQLQANQKDEVVKSLVHNVMLHLADHVRASPTRTRITALKWISMLLMISPNTLTEILDHLFPPLLGVLASRNDDVVLLDLKVLSKISSLSKANFESVLKQLIDLFRYNRTLLDERGSMIVRHLSVLLDGETIYVALATLLSESDDLEFASYMIQTLNLILLTSSELFQLRSRIKNSLQSETGKELFATLYKSWCHNSMSTLSLCLLAQAYELGSALVFQFADIPITVGFLMQIDKLVQLIESPIFVHLRLQLLEPQSHPFLVKVMYGLLMLLPQSTAFNSLRIRLQSVSTLGLLQSLPESKFAHSQSLEKVSGMDFESLLKHFQLVQEQHDLYRNREESINEEKKEE